MFELTFKARGMSVILIAILVLWIWCFHRCANDQLVLYFDAWDVFISCASLVCLLVACFDMAGPFLRFLAIIGLFVTTYMVFRNAMLHNRTLPKAIAVAIFKITFGWSWTCLVFNHLNVATNRDRSNAERVQSLVILAALGWLVTKVVNGRRVYAAQGWPLPATVQLTRRTG